MLSRFIGTALMKAPNQRRKSWCYFPEASGRSTTSCVVITAKGQVAISSKTSAKILADSAVIIKAPKVTASKGIFESKNIKDLG